MEFEQLGFDFSSLMGRIDPGVDSGVDPGVDPGGFVCPKIDWMTVMFQNCTMNHVLRWLKLESAVSDFLAGAYEQSRGYNSIVKFMFNNVLLETTSWGFYGAAEGELVFDVVVPKIRLDLSGSGLDYLRSCGLDMDSYRFIAPELPEGGSYHITRLDVAFDFINYHPEFIDKLIEHISVHALPSGRVPLASGSAITYRIVTGNQKTVYLGSTSSERMVRIYDKRMQYVNLMTGVYMKENPYNNPESWIRVEWQLRNHVSHNMALDHNLEFKHILKLIFDQYAFADGTEDNTHKQRSIIPFWLDFFPWEEVESKFVQNTSFVQYVSPSERVVSSFENVMLRTFMFYASIVGRKGLISACNRYLASLENSDPVSVRRRTAFLWRLNELQNDGFELSDDASFGLINVNGRIYFIG